MSRFDGIYGTANQWWVLAGVVFGCGVSALPLVFEHVREKEAKIAQARCAPAILNG
jgi:hypothetical protein